MSNVLGEAVVQLGVQGDAALAAELAATEAKLAGVQDQADKTAQAVGQAAAAGRAAPASRPTGVPIPRPVVNPVGAGSSAALAKTAAGAGVHGALASEQANQDLQAEAEKRNANLRQSVILERERAKYAASPAGIKAKRDEVKLSKDLVAAQRAVKWKEAVAANGYLGASFQAARERLGALQGDAERLGGVFTGVFAAGAGSIFSFVAAANPAAFSTFKGSVESVAIAVGQAFVPFVDQASAGLQGLSGWIEGLDDGLKSTAAKVVLAATVVGALGVAARAAAFSFGGLGTAAMTAGRLITLGMGGPVTTAIVGATALVGTLAAAWWGVSKAAEGAGGVMGRAGSQRIAPGGGMRQVREYSPEEVALMPARYRTRFERIEAGQQRLEKWDELARIKDEQKRQAERKALLDEIPGLEPDVRKTAIESGELGELRRKEIQDKIDAARKSVAEAFSRDLVAQAEALPNYIQADIAKNPKDRRKILDEYRESIEKQINRMQGGLLDAVKREETRVQERQALLEKAAASPEATKELQKQLAAIAKRKGLRPDEAVAAMQQDPTSPEAMAAQEAFRTAVLKINPDPDLTGREMRDYLQIQVRDNQNPEIGAFRVGKLPPRDIQADWTKTIEQLRGKVAMVGDLLTGVGGGPGAPGMARNLALPIQSRYSTFEQYSESLQIKGLEGNELDKLNELKKLQNILDSIGDGNKLLVRVVTNTRLLEVLANMFGGQ